MLATSSSSGIQAALSFHSASSSHDLFGCCVAKKQCFRAKAQTVTRRQHPFSRATVRGDASQRSQNASRRHRRIFSYSCKYGDNNHQPQCGGAVLKPGGAFCSVVAGPQTSGRAGRLPGDRDTQQRLCRLGGVGLVSQRRRNARTHTKRTPWLAVGTHTKSQRTHLTKPSDITQHHETCLAGRRVRPSIKLLDIGLETLL